MLEGKHPLVSAQGMYAFQTMLNFFIPSASGQAMVSMPLMVPLSDLLGISRQTAVLIFISGDGFSNLVVPISGVLMVPNKERIKFMDILLHRVGVIQFDIHYCRKVLLIAI